MTGAASAAGLVVALVALAAGWLIGSIPLAPTATRAAGPGWAFLALTAGLAKGVIPVAAGVVTVSWAIGWVAGIGAVLGAARPAFGRPATGMEGAGSVAATFAGVAVALAPPAGALAAVVAVVAYGAVRLLGRDAARSAAASVAAGAIAYPLLFVALQPDPTRVGALVGLYLVAALMLLVVRRREPAVGA